jgi:hypothetical protein
VRAPRAREAGWQSHIGKSWAGCRGVFPAPVQSPTVLYISPSLPNLFSVCPKLSQHSTIPALPFPDCHLLASRGQQDTYLGTQETYMSFASPLDHNHLIITTFASPFGISTVPLASPLRPMRPKQSSTCATDGSARGYFSCFLFTSRRGNFPHLNSLLG